METRRQKQIASEIQVQLAQIFLKEGYSIVKGALVTIAQVKVTPDLLIVKIYLSFLNAEDKQLLLQHFNEHKREIRGFLGKKMNNLRRIPELEFYTDDTLEEVFRMEQLFQSMKKENEEEQ